ncbi:MAG: hypothetical protein IT555_12865 [Acetobacteraceae bacterium]|nr:hypothetical protein [Acetobacteraceae bacterium]
MPEKIRLGLPREPRWVALAGTARVLVRPATTALISAAQHAAMAEADAIRAGRQGLLDAGAAVDGFDLDDPHIVAGLAHDLMVRALARCLITDWDGVFDAEGNALAFDPKLLPQLMAIEDVAAAFWKHFLEPERRRVLEGNASAPSPNGTSAGAPDIAGAANRPVGEPAPTSATLP